MIVLEWIVSTILGFIGIFNVGDVMHRNSLTWAALYLRSWRRVFQKERVFVGGSALSGSEV